MALPQKQTDRAVAATLAPRLKAARAAAGLTLKTLSAATGLSQPFLSRLERGQVCASIANLLQICRALDLSLAGLVDGAAAAPAASWEIFRGGCAALAADGYSFRALAPALARRRMDAFVLDFPPGQAMALVVAHEGEELLFVVAGSIEFRFGAEAAVLRAGDAVQFDASLPHSAANPGPRPARLLMVTTPARGEALGWQRFIGAAANEASPTKTLAERKRR